MTNGETRLAELLMKIDGSIHSELEEPYWREFAAKLIGEAMTNGKGSAYSAEARRFHKWLVKLQSYAMSEAEHTVDITAAFWRECFDDGMTPEQAFRESFVEQDGEL